MSIPILVNLQYLGVIMHPYAILCTTFGGCTTNETPTFDLVNSWPVVLDGGVYRAKNPLSRGIDGMLQLNLLQLMQTPPPRRKAVSKSSLKAPFCLETFVKVGFSCHWNRYSPVSRHCPSEKSSNTYLLWCISGPPNEETRPNSWSVCVTMRDWKYLHVYRARFF